MIRNRTGRHLYVVEVGSGGDASLQPGTVEVVVYLLTQRPVIGSDGILTAEHSNECGRILFGYDRYPAYSQGSHSLQDHRYGRRWRCGDRPRSHRVRHPNGVRCSPSPQDVGNRDDPDQSGGVVDLPGIEALGRAGDALVALDRDNCIPLPTGSELFLLPGREPVGGDARTGDLKAVTGVTALAAFLAPAHTQLFTPAYRTTAGAPRLPLFAYTAVGLYRGRYFVTGGLLSPLDGVRAEDLPFGRLAARLDTDGVTEVIIALDASVEGETTALYLQQLFASRDLKMTRLATGIPVGGALAYIDEVTLQRAFQFRRSF